MKVIQINVDWDNGGPGTIEKDIYDTLISQGHKCKIIYSRGKYPENNDLIRIGNDFDIKVHALLSRITGLEGYFSIKATKRIINVIRNYNPDIIQLHNLLGHYINHPYLFRFLKGLNIPIVWTLHDCSPFTGHCINFDRVNCEKWKIKCDKCPLYKEYPYSYIFDTSKKIFEDKQKWFSELNNLHLIAPSQWMFNIIKDSILKKKNLVVINNGINLEQFEPTKSDLRKQYKLEDKVVLLSAAYIWNEMKGIKVLKELSDKMPEKYALVLIGNNSDKSLLRNTIFIPAISDKRILAQWYSTADIFVNPTLGDNFPTVNIEALSCGTPIVTYNTGGSPEIVGSECGQIVKSNTVKELIEKIQMIDTNTEMRIKCRKRALEYDRNIVYKKYLQLYQNILNL